LGKQFHFLNSENFIHPPIVCHSSFEAIDSARYRYAQTLQTFEEKNVNLKFVLGFEGTALVNP